jgi:hypothetical protein
MSENPVALIQTCFKRSDNDNLQFCPLIIKLNGTDAKFTLESKIGDDL